VGICASVALNRRGFVRAQKRQSVGGASIVLCRWDKKVIRNHPKKESETTLYREWEGEGKSLESWYNSFPKFPQIFSNSSQVLQLGIMIHSLVIGLTLAVTSGSDFSMSLSRFLSSLLMSFSFIDNRNHLPPAL
jgi:hypothetical protein